MHASLSRRRSEIMGANVSALRLRQVMHLEVGLNLTIAYFVGSTPSSIQHPGGIDFYESFPGTTEVMDDGYSIELGVSSQTKQHPAVLYDQNLAVNH